MTEITKEVKLTLLKNELAVYHNTVYILSVRHRVNKKLGQTEEQLKPIADEMAKAEMAIDELQKVIIEVEKE